VAQKYPAIPDPLASMNSVQSTAAALKEGFEILTRQRGSKMLAAVTWEDLVRLGLVTPDKVPR
jgi:hypothetical protein